MRGLWRKDFFLGKKYLLLGAVASALLIFLSYWMRLAFIYGNLALLSEADWTESTRSLDMVLPVLPGVVLLFIGIKAVNVSIYADRQAGWNSYLLASPLGERVIVASKYLEFMEMELAMLALSLAVASVYGLFFGFERLPIWCLSLLGAAVLASLCESILLPASYRYQSENMAVGFAFLGMMLPGYLAAGAAAVSISYPEQVMEQLGSWCRSHLWWLAAAALGIAALLLALSYGISLRIVKTRKWYW